MKRNRNIQNDLFTSRRRSLRRRQIKAEYVLWQELRAKRIGFLVRRQMNIGKYVVDFYCHELKLIIELDGPIHKDQVSYDKRRQRWLEYQGYYVVRSQNDDILFDRERIMQELLTLSMFLNHLEG